MTRATLIARTPWLRSRGLRLDAEAYSSGALAARDAIESSDYAWRRLDAVGEVSYPGRFARRYVRDRSRGTPFLSSSDMLLADLNAVPNLANDAIDESPELLIREGWTLISRSGSIGNTAYVRREMDGMAASEHVIRVRSRGEAALSGYLFAFLSSTIGQLLLKSQTYGTIIQHIEPHHIADLPVPLPDPTFQQRIHDLINSAATARAEASRLLDKAALYLDGQAGLLQYKHDHARAKGIVQRSQLNWRLDAFHHVGWAVEPRALAGTSLGSVARVSRPGIVKRIFVERGTPFVSGIDVFQHRPTFRQRIMTAEANRASTWVRSGQILIQRGGQRYGLLGRPAMVTRRMNGWSASEDLIRIDLRDSHDVPWVFAYLRSESGRRQTLRHSYGTSIPKLNEAGVAALHVPDLPQELAAGATRALALREQADADEERAIHEVEAWLG